jgi:hypothetical protein
MKKFIFSAILISNSVLLMGQNFNQQTNILVSQTRSGNSNNRSWLTNEANTNTNKPSTNRNIETNIQRRGNTNISNENIQQRQVNRNPGNNPSTVRNINPAPERNDNNPIQIQRQSANIYRGNNRNTEVINSDEQQQSISNENNNPVIFNGNMNINKEQVQNKQNQFLADNNSKNLQLVKQEFNLEFNIEQKTQVKTAKIKTEKIKTTVSAELKTVNLKVKNNSSASKPLEIANIKTKSSVSEKHKGGSSYSQKNKSYMGKKIKIWCQKNLKFAKKIRMSVSCPKF